MRAAIPASATVAYGLMPDAYAIPRDWTSVVSAFTGSPTCNRAVAFVWIRCNLVVTQTSCLAQRMPDILQDLPIAAPPQRVFEVISTPKLIDEWWTLSSSGEPVVGATYKLDFGPEYQWT